LSRPAETDNLLNYCNKVLCMDWLFYRCVLSKKLCWTTTSRNDCVGGWRKFAALSV